MSEPWNVVSRVVEVGASSGILYLCLLSFVVATLIGIVRRCTTTSGFQRAAWPEKEVKKAPTGNVGASGRQGYRDTFPPSQRASLAKLGHKFAGAAEIDLAATPKNILKLEDDYRSAHASDFVFSGFSVGDIRSLGGFPNYAALSGVPLPSPLQNFDVDKAMPRPYRPFRWPYHQTMSLAKMDTDFWLELENTYRRRIVERQQIHAEHGEHILNALPGSELALKELVEMVVQFLCARYPGQFSVDENKVLSNKILGTKTNLAEEDPLMFLLNNVPEEFCVMLRDDETGRYVLRAGVLCSSVGWQLSDKIGKELSGIHVPVPDYKKKMELSMDRFFTKMPTDKPIQRASWSLEMGESLFVPPQHPELRSREVQDPDLGPDNVFLRVDWQTLRRLPLSGAIVFNFKSLFTPMTEFEDEPCVPKLVRTILEEGKEEMIKYKGTWHIEHVAKPVLRRYEQAQIDKGLMEEAWEPRTLDEAPFFRGWERKWVAE